MAHSPRSLRPCLHGRVQIARMSPKCTRVRTGTPTLTAKTALSMPLHKSIGKGDAVKLCHFMSTIKLVAPSCATRVIVGALDRQSSTAVTVPILAAVQSSSGRRDISPHCRCGAGATTPSSLPLWCCTRHVAGFPSAFLAAAESLLFL